MSIAVVVMVILFMTCGWWVSEGATRAMVWCGVKKKKNGRVAAVARSFLLFSVRKSSPQVPLPSRQLSHFSCPLVSWPRCCFVWVCCVCFCVDFYVGLKFVRSSFLSPFLFLWMLQFECVIVLVSLVVFFFFLISVLFKTIADYC